MGTTAWSGVAHYEIFSGAIQRHTFKEVCESVGVKDALLITASSSGDLDCMGTMVFINKFCRQKDKKNLLRGVIEKDSKQVLCQYGDGAELSVVCDEKHSDLCLNAAKSCNEMRKYYSQEVPLYHSSVTNDVNRKRELNCYFSFSDIKRFLPGDDETL